MARKQGKRGEYRPGNPDFLPMTDAERRMHADALMHVHAGHQCAERAAALCMAGEYYAMAGRHDVAESALREALGIEDAEPGSVHATFASFLFDRGRDEEALALIAEARRLHPEDLGVYDYIGEALETHGYLPQAARWFTAGLVARLGELAALQGDDLRTDVDIRLLACGRFRVRQAQDLPLDHIDTLVRDDLAATSPA